jgi:hypothetical protein
VSADAVKEGEAASQEPLPAALESEPEAEVVAGDVDMEAVPPTQEEEEEVEEEVVQAQQEVEPGGCWRALGA